MALLRVDQPPIRIMCQLLLVLEIDGNDEVFHFLMRKKFYEAVLNDVKYFNLFH